VPFVSGRRTHSSQGLPNLLRSCRHVQALDPRRAQRVPDRVHDGRGRRWSRFGQVDAKSDVDPAQVIGQAEGQAVGLGHAVAVIEQLGERQRAGLLGLPRGARHLGRDDGERGADGGDLGQRLLQSLQLRGSVRSQRPR
jgi:hypothetical protein